jgi:putative hemolysin
VFIGNEIVNISISVVTAALVYAVAKDSFSGTALPFISMAVTVPVLLIFGEIIPKTIAVNFPERIARINSFVLYPFSRAITPLRMVLNAAAKVFIRLFVKDPTLQPVDTVHIDEDMFKSIVDIGRKEGIIEPGERDLIYRVFRLDDIALSQIMTPREEIAAIPLVSTEQAVRTILEEKKYSRYPVYDTTLDNIVGFIHAKSLLKQTVNAQADKKFSLASLLRTPAFIQETGNALSAFLQLKRNKTHIAIVTDGRGITAGIITMEDILEELFGDIRDETDMEDEGHV